MINLWFTAGTVSESFYVTHSCNLTTRFSHRLHTERRVRTKRHSFSLRLTSCALRGFQDDAQFTAADQNYMRSFIRDRTIRAEDGTAADVSLPTWRNISSKSLNVLILGPDEKGKKKKKFSSVLIPIMTNHSWSPPDNIKHIWARNYFWQALFLCWGWHVRRTGSGRCFFRNREVVRLKVLK